MKKVEKTQGKGDFGTEITKIMEGSKVKIAELTNDLQRTRADFENYRKQVEVQRENAAKTAKFATVMRLLPLIDDIDRAVASYKNELGPVSGVLMALEAASKPAEDVVLKIDENGTSYEQ